VTTRIPRAEVRRRLLDAAAEVFAHRGYEAARLDEIAAAAGFTKGAVYSNFAGKPALFAALVAQEARTELAIGSREVGAHPGHTLDGIAEAFATRIAGTDTRSRLAVEVAQQAAHDPAVREVYVEVRRALRAELAAALTEGGAARGLEPTVSIDRIALTLAALRLGLALEHGADPDQVDRAAVAGALAVALGAFFRPAARGSAA
jgi:AcrR family transcriptional regulator